MQLPESARSGKLSLILSLLFILSAALIFAGCGPSIMIPRAPEVSLEATPNPGDIEEMAGFLRKIHVDLGTRDIVNPAFKHLAEVLEVKYARDAGVADYIADYTERTGESLELAAGYDILFEGMFKACDPHSEYFAPQAWAAYVEALKGTMVGVGVILQQAKNPVVWEVFPGSPADGILAKGDVITSIEGESTFDMKPARYNNLLAGPEGSEVVLTVDRHGDTFGATIARRRFAFQSVLSAWTGRTNGVMHIRVRVFQRGTAAGVQESLKIASKNKKLKGIVLDLRDNLGGLVDEARDICDSFIHTGPAFQRLGYRPGVMNATNSGIDFPAGVPVIVIVNTLSGSSSEIVAQCLRDFGAAIILGENTYGKGTMQDLFSFNSYRGCKVTSARLAGPSGASWQRDGIVPDIFIADSMLEARIEMMENAGLEHAIGEKATRGSLPNRPAGKLEFEGANLSRLIAKFKAEAARYKSADIPGAPESDRCLNTAVYLLESN